MRLYLHRFYSLTEKMTLRTVAQEGELEIYGKIEVATEGLTPEDWRTREQKITPWSLRSIALQ